MNHVEITKQLFLRLYKAYNDVEYTSEDKTYFYNQACAIHTLLVLFGVDLDEIAELKNQVRNELQTI